MHVYLTILLVTASNVTMCSYFGRWAIMCPGCVCGLFHFVYDYCLCNCCL